MTLRGSYLAPRLFFRLLVAMLSQLAEGSAFGASNYFFQCYLCGVQLIARHPAQPRRKRILCPLMLVLVGGLAIPLRNVQFILDQLHKDRSALLQTTQLRLGLMERFTVFVYHSKRYTRCV